MATAWVLPDSMNSDVILPGRYLTMTDENELSQYVFSGWDTELAKKIGVGDIIVAGRNFGCGSGREQGPLAIKGLGIRCIIAESFARIFYRNAVNLGLLVLESKEPIFEKVESKDEVELESNWESLTNITKKTHISLVPPPKYLLNIIHSGGIVPYLKKKFSSGG